MYEGGDGAVQWQSAGERLSWWRWDTHACTRTHLWRVLITLHRNSLSECIEALGYMYIANKTNSYFNQAQCTHTHTFRDNTAYTIPWPCISLLQTHSKTPEQLTNINQANHHLSSLSTIRPRQESESRPVPPDSLPQVSEGYFLHAAVLLFELECNAVWLPVKSVHSYSLLLSSLLLHCAVMCVYSWAISDF